MKIFVDASALIPLFRTIDPLHEKAVQLSPQLVGNTLLISNYIFSEVVTVLSQKEGKEKALDAGEYIKKNYTMFRIDAEIEDLAWEIFKKQKSKNVSFVDCTTFALFQRRMFDKAFAFDTDFKANKIPLVD